MRANFISLAALAILIAGFVLFERRSDVGNPARDDKPRILCASKNFLEGMVLSKDDVVVRPVKPDEMDQFLRNKHKYMPPILAAADLRILARDLAADEPLLKEHFQDLCKWPPLKLRPGMRAVHLTAPVFRDGDHVDVYLTADVCDDADCKDHDPDAALVAQNAVGVDIVVDDLTARAADGDGAFHVCSHIERWPAPGPDTNASTSSTRTGISVSIPSAAAPGIAELQIRMASARE